MFEKEKGIGGKEGEGEGRVPQGSNVGFCVIFKQVVKPLWMGKCIRHDVKPSLLSFVD
jgi:hypothetical protein